MNYPAASYGVSDLSSRSSHPRRRVSRKNVPVWIPAFAGMTEPQQAAGNETHRDSNDQNRWRLTYCFEHWSICALNSCPFRRVNFEFRISRFKFDAFVKSRKTPFSVIPAKAGIQFIHRLTKHLDSGFHRSDDFLRVHQI
jgi:hypothetical protein